MWSPSSQGVERGAGLAYTPWPRGSPDRFAGEAKWRVRRAPQVQGQHRDPRAKGAPGGRGRKGIRDDDSWKLGPDPGVELRHCSPRV